MTLKIFWNSFVIGIIAIIACAALFLGGLYEYIEDQVFAGLAENANCIAQGIESAGDSYFSGLTSDNRVTWFDADGQVLYDSEADEQENYPDLEEIQEALESGSGQSERYSNTILEKTLYYAEQLDDGTMLRVSATISTAAALILEMLQPTLWMIVLILALAGVLATRMTKRITKPINNLDLDRPETYETYQELAPLVRRLRQQNYTIRKQMDELSRERQEFGAITENMKEGFLLVDGKYNILSANSSILSLLAKNETELPACLTRTGCLPEVYDAVQAALAGERSEHMLSLDDNTLQIIASPVVSNGQVTGAVAVAMDVTEREQRERLRREFSANVSHELKTPLTSISGFAELMKSGLVGPDKMREFSGDIYEESSRLITLVGDIIRLSELDEDVRGFVDEEVDLYVLAEDVLENLKPIAEKRDVEMRVMGDHTVICGAWQIVNEIVYNLCNNAVKYNKVGGIVTVTVSHTEDGARLVVADTGIGIPPTEQSRVFERFYRVDKSHSKEVGGTGLGLSIVKHGAQYLGARIELASELDKGTEITILFPKQ